jgi:hypothetical protein
MKGNILFCSGKARFTHIILIKKISKIIGKKTITVNLVARAAAKVIEINTICFVVGFETYSRS